MILRAPAITSVLFALISAAVPIATADGVVAVEFGSSVTEVEFGEHLGTFLEYSAEGDVDRFRLEITRQGRPDGPPGQQTPWTFKVRIVDVPQVAPPVNGRVSDSFFVGMEDKRPQMDEHGAFSTAGTQEPSPEHLGAYGYSARLSDVETNATFSQADLTVWVKPFVAQTPWEPRGPARETVLPSPVWLLLICLLLARIGHRSSWID